MSERKRGGEGERERQRESEREREREMYAEGPAVLVVHNISL